MAGDRIEVTLAVDGMTCGGCVASVKRALERLDGVESADVALDPPAARVRYDAGSVSPELLVQAIEDAGFAVPEMPAGTP